MGVVAEIAAVHKMRIGVNVVACCDRVIQHLPYATAKEPIVFVDQIPILLEVTGAVAHRVAVFAKEKGVLQMLVLGVMRFDLIGENIHTAVDRGDGGIELRVLLRLNIQGLVAVIQALGDILAMHEVARIARAQILCHRHVVAACARLVSERPENNAGVIFVTLVHPLHTVKIRVLPILVVGEAIPIAHADGTVCFQIGLVYHVKAVFVAKSDKAGVVGVMAGADHIDVMTL